MTTQAKRKVAPKKSGAKRKPRTDADRERMRKSKAKQAKENKRLDAYAKDTLGTGKVESKVEALLLKEKQLREEQKRIDKLLKNQKKVIDKQKALEKKLAEEARTAEARARMDAWLKENKDLMRSLMKELGWKNADMVKKLGLSKGVVNAAKKDEHAG